MATLTTAQKNILQWAIDFQVKGNAPEIPFDDKVIQEVGKVAASTGFESAGKFKEDAKLTPISTLLRFIKFIGT